MGKKTDYKKSRLANECMRNRRVPVFVIIRTKRRIMNNIYRRNWRTDKLHIPKSPKL